MSTSIISSPPSTHCQKNSNEKGLIYPSNRVIGIFEPMTTTHLSHCPESTTTSAASITTYTPHFSQPTIANMSTPTAVCSSNKRNLISERPLTIDRDNDNIATTGTTQNTGTPTNMKEFFAFMETIRENNTASSGTIQNTRPLTNMEEFFAFMKTMRKATQEDTEAIRKCSSPATTETLPQPSANNYNNNNNNNTATTGIFRTTGTTTNSKFLFATSTTATAFTPPEPAYENDIRNFNTTTEFLPTGSLKNFKPTISSTTNYANTIKATLNIVTQQLFNEAIFTQHLRLSLTSIALKVSTPTLNAWSRPAIHIIIKHRTEINQRIKRSQATPTAHCM
jgi:hypothetical protein